MKVRIRKFEFFDIEKKIEWINSYKNNRYLHYDLPLEYEKTVAWFEKNKDRQDRYDAVIEVDDVPVGLIGLLSIDLKNKKAEYYVSMGEVEYKGKGIATQASKVLLEYAFIKLGLNKIYLYTEEDNILAQKLFEKIGFEKEGLLQDDLFVRGQFVNRFFYGITKKQWSTMNGK